MARCPRAARELERVQVEGIRVGEERALQVRREEREDADDLVLGKTREVGFDVPEEAGSYELKCYVPGDIETIIEVKVGAAGATEDSGY